MQLSLSYMLISIIGCSLLLAGWIFFGPLAALAVGAAPVAFYIALRHPYAMCLVFVTMSFTRIHEAIPVLIPLHLPQLFALATLAAVTWQWWNKKLDIYLTRELILLLLFAFLVTLSIPFAYNRPHAFTYWENIFLKILVMTFALAWLCRKPSHYQGTIWLILICDAIVALVALYNKVHGIGLVGEDRVTVSRHLGSFLGDPNYLALTLLFPLSFAIAAATAKIEFWQRVVVTAIGAILIAAILATKSRGGLLGVAAIGGLFLYQHMRSKTLFIVGTLLACVLLYVVGGMAERTADGKGLMELDASSMGRIYAWQAALRMTADHPITGIGLDNFFQAYFYYTPYWDNRPHDVHSTWFGVMGETGLPSFVVFMLLVTLVVRKAIKTDQMLQHLASDRLSPWPRIMNQGILLGLAGWIISGTFISQGFTWPFYLLLAYTVSLHRFAKQAQASQAGQI